MPVAPSTTDGGRASFSQTEAGRRRVASFYFFPSFLMSLTKAMFFYLHTYTQFFYVYITIYTLHLAYTFAE